MKEEKRKINVRIKQIVDNVVSQFVFERVNQVTLDAIKFMLDDQLNVLLNKNLITMYKVAIYPMNGGINLRGGIVYGLPGKINRFCISFTMCASDTFLEKNLS